MPSESEQLEQLQSATLLYSFTRNLKKSAIYSLGWGVFSLSVAVALYQTTFAVWAGLALSSMLILEGVYLLFVRKPYVVLVATLTLAALAAWNLLGFAWVLYTSQELGVHPIAGLLQALGAFQTYRTYGLYVHLTNTADPSIVARVKTILSDLASSTSLQIMDVAAFELRGFVEDEPYWRVKRVGDCLLFAAVSEKILGFDRNRSLQAFWARCADVRLEQEGEGWMDRRVQFRIHIGPNAVIKAKSTRDMFERIETLLASAR